MYLWNIFQKEYLDFWLLQCTLCSQLYYNFHRFKRKAARRLIVNLKVLGNSTKSSFLRQFSTYLALAAEPGIWVEMRRWRWMSWWWFAPNCRQRTLSTWPSLKIRLMWLLWRGDHPVVIPKWKPGSESFSETSTVSSWGFFNPTHTKKNNSLK